MYKFRPLIRCHIRLYHGKRFAKQYIKENQFDLALKWALSKSTGYMLGFEIYAEKSVNNDKTFGLGGDSVMYLINNWNTLPNKGFKIFFQQLFYIPKVNGIFSRN